MFRRSLGVFKSKNSKQRVCLTEPRHIHRHAPFTDRVKALITSGTGGDGRSAMTHVFNQEFAGPGGGNGGRGGHVFLRCTRKHLDLFHIKELGPRITAAPGTPGGFQLCHGKRGEDLLLELPPGTQVLDVDTNEVLYDMEEGDEALLLEGGSGGRGNASFTTAMQHAPKEATTGMPGGSMLTQLELKVLADVGLIGFPNAGKSSIVASVTTSTPLIAPYPFSTLHPSIGDLHFRNVKCTIADLPGLIEGAYENRGLGHEFLRHCERTHLLAYVIDMTSEYQLGDDPDPLQPWDVLEVLQNELEFFKPGLSDRAAVVLANKMDIEKDVFGDSVQEKYEELCRQAPSHLRVFPISALDCLKDGVDVPSNGLKKAATYLASKVVDMKREREKAKREQQEEDRRELGDVFRDRYKDFLTPPNKSDPTQIGHSFESPLRMNEYAMGGGGGVLGADAGSLVNNQLDPYTTFQTSAEEQVRNEQHYHHVSHPLSQLRDFTLRGQSWQLSRDGERLPEEEQKWGLKR